MTDAELANYLQHVANFCRGKGNTEAAEVAFEASLRIEVLSKALFTVQVAIKRAVTEEAYSPAVRGALDAIR
jgi:hypothetical protein